MKMVTRSASLPAAASLPGVEYVPTIDRVVLFGGFQHGFAPLFNDTWAYDFAANRWTNLDPANPPAPRPYPCRAHERKTDRIVMFGGTMGWSESGAEVGINESGGEPSLRMPGSYAWHAMSRTNGPVLAFGGEESLHVDQRHVPLHLALQRVEESVRRGG